MSSIGAMPANGQLKCVVCQRKVDLIQYWPHVQARHPKSAAISTQCSIQAEPEEVHIFSEIARLAREIHKYRFGAEGKVDKNKLKNYEREIRSRLEKGETVPGFKPFIQL